MREKISTTSLCDLIAIGVDFAPCSIHLEISLGLGFSPWLIFCTSSKKFLPMPSKSSKPVQPADSRSRPSPPPQTLPVQNLPTTSNPEPTKKKKKKKNKSKTTPVATESRVEPKYEEDEDEDDDIPPLEPAPGLYRSLTGLPPELEAVHLSATASLSATVAAAARNNPTAAAHAELIAAADDLCRRMDADPQGGISTDDDYWKSLPEHIRNFVSANRIASFRVRCSNG